MIKQVIQISILSLALGLGSTSYGQIKREKQAEKSFEGLSYVNAISIYERIVDKGRTNQHVLQNLADSYYFNGKLVEANKWYTELFEGDYKDKDLTQLSSEYYYRYAQTLKAVEDYDKAKVLMSQFSALEAEDSRAALYAKNTDYLTSLENRSDRYDLQLVDFNTEYSDYGAAILEDTFVFTSARNTDHSGKKTHSWTNQSFTSLYSVKQTEEGSSNPVLFAPELKSKVNDATAVFTADGNTMYFTRNNSKRSGRSKQNKNYASLLKIYKTVKDESGKWGKVEELPFNSDNFNTAHPALTADGKWLYFTSDRTGTLGQSDLYRVALLEDGQYGEIENIGEGVNTSGRESFPFISSDNKLYFSSDGHPGLGGLDIFVTDLHADGSFGDVLNIGAPINSSMDDFSFYLDAVSKKGFVSSNRSGGVGSDDIYSVVEKLCQQRIEGIAYDKDTNEVLSNTLVVISDALYTKSDSVRTNNEGYYISSLLDCGHKYRIKAEKENYDTVEVVFNADETPGDKKVDLLLPKAKLNMDLFKELNLQPIYFDFDKSFIRKDAAIELMKVVEVMKEYPTMKIDVRSHTDSRGNDAYNMSLSDRRVKSTIKWMIKQGIDASRLTGRGYGESELVNKCSNGVPCSAANHELNRRSEFIIVEI